MKKIFLSYPAPDKTSYAPLFPQNCFPLLNLMSIYRYASVSWQYFKCISQNKKKVFYKYIICYYNSDKYRSVNRLFDVGQREVAFFLFTLVTNKGEHSIFSQSKQILTR